MSAITQAHVAYCHGDKIVADNVHFISRLNMNPLNGQNVFCSINVIWKVPTMR